MKTCRTQLIRLIVLCLASKLSFAQDAAETAPPPASQVEFFESRVRPLLVEHCYACHSAQSEDLGGGLRLDFRGGPRAGGESGPAIIPGDAEQSLLIDAVRYRSLEMPPDGKLPELAIATLEKWVEMGAPDPRTSEQQEPKRHQAQSHHDHWAFQPVQRPQPPQVKLASWPLSNIDHFVLQELERHELHPAKDADRLMWLRRVTFDLIGMPPTVAEVNRFQQDRSPQAYEAAVDQLLASRSFGERWARHWLDLVGYADQIGTSNNLFAEHAWRYRDYLIDAFNQDKPFDQVIREQIAGDLIESDTLAERAAAMTATGFLVLGDLEVVEADKEKMRVDIVDQQVVKVSKAFLGMTVGCARCHDHKFDPISQRDYYAIAGFFHSTESVYKTNRGVWSDVNTLELPEDSDQIEARRELTVRHAQRIANLRRERQELTERKTALAKRSARITDSEKTPSAEELEKQQTRLTEQIGQLNKAIEHAEFFAPTAPRSYGVRDSQQPADMQITIRGNPRALGDRVARGFLSVTKPNKPKISSDTSGRRELADWIASRANPLTARVAVNRIWQKLFGFGLVRSVDYFGVRGEMPSHPELLDHLASRFVDDHWSQKRLIRSLVLSRIYRTSSEHNSKAYSIDPENRLLWRMDRRRLDAEALRDALLAISGRLHPSAGGPAMPLEFPENVANIDPVNVNPPSFSLKKWRPVQEFQRTIYLPVIRSGPQPGPGELRNVFDFTQPAQFAGERPVTAVPTQALFLMNSPFVREFAQQLADRIERESTGVGARFELLWLLALNRTITIDEKQAAADFIEANDQDAWIELCHAVLASNEFLIRL